MPTICQFSGISIAMYHNDHSPPHFHARDADGRARVRIDTFEALDSTLSPRALRMVRRWAALHQTELMMNWNLARAGATLQKIEPLR